MHSSRMRTVRCSGRLIKEGCLPAQGGGGCLPRVVYTSPSQWTEFLTHICENITFPQLRLRTVKIDKKV